MSILYFYPEINNLQYVDMKAVEKKRFKVSRWIFLSLAVLTNGFLVAYSSFSKETANRLNNWITNIFAGFINNITEKEVVHIPIEELNISLSDDQYNVIPGYELNQIPLGSAKEITYSFLPNNATDTAVEYYTADIDKLVLNSSGNKVSVVGIKEGMATVSCINKYTGLSSSILVEVKDTVAPTKFDVSVTSNSVSVGSQLTIDFDIDGGVLGHDELINFRYYNIRKLDFSSSNELVATIDEYGVIRPLSVGFTTITVKNLDNGFYRTLDINVVSGSEPQLYEDLHISGSNVCYENDMLNSQTSSSYQYPLSIYDGDILLKSDDFIWESSNDLLVRVDKHGVMRGFRKTSLEDENVVITATSKITGQFTTFNVVVKERVPTMIDFLITNGKQRVWNVDEYTACIGDDVNLYIYYDVKTSHKDVSAVSSDETVVQITNQGTSLSLQLKKEGSARISVESEVNPNLKFEFDFKVLKAGAISGDEMDNMRLSVRKVVGHAALFLIAEVFTIICLYMFLYNKKYCVWIALIGSLLAELLVSTISEIIQNNIPGRDGNVRDVFINFAGAVIGVTIVALTFVVIKHFKNKRKNSKPKK